ncbi:ABC transporter ATP-binding protein [Bifidobacterium sp. ESL0682]|uniref:ABC transporter ATP-binding protein n=1 Tax=Bifidobacterium sp. ESL0682 TaxID=2983212 RepID=UPI0023F95283|nr:ABC transporter ATP-binding protein [Bifidobacterium sp. ESL0682]WEV42727.1 ABC transporter ATP-binding protein [Bifidobacterium sp. ESL0682]
MALSITDAAKRYSSGFGLGPVTFDLPMGYIMGLIGPNGAGKSTLIKLILNMIHRDAGSISVAGFDNITDEVKVKEQLGIVFDSSYFSTYWTVKMAEKSMAAAYPTWNHSLFVDYLGQFGIDTKKKVKDLSRGMQMKLMLAAALSHDAKLLILDEPTSGLDVLARDDLMDILQRYVDDGQHSVLFSTHITSDLEHAADLITYITQGKLYFTGAKDEFDDAFRLVKGGPDELDAVSPVAVGIRSYLTGFDALVHTEGIAELVQANPELHVDPVSIDDIIRLTNGRAAGPQRHEEGSNAR